MPGRRVSIAVVMKLTAIIALNLAVVRLLADVLWILTFPPVLFMTMLLDLALLQSLAFGQPLRTFYFTFLIVGVLSIGVITVLTSRRPWQAEKTWGTLHILETTIQHYRTVRGQRPVTPLHVEFPELAAAEQWLTYILVGLLPGLAAVLASWWMRRRGRRRNKWGQAVAAFLQGALIGFGLYVGATLDSAPELRDRDLLVHIVGPELKRDHAVTGVSQVPLGSAAALHGEWEMQHQRKRSAERLI